MTVRVGSDVRAVCRRCGPVWHVVIALAGGRIANVECGDCKARHRYRPAPGSPGPAPRRGPARAADAPARTARRAASKTVVEADPSRPRRPFRTTDTYAVGDRVVHARFGEGVVQAVTGAKKVEVLFPDGAKTLVHGREAG